MTCWAALLLLLLGFFLQLLQPAHRPLTTSAGGGPKDGLPEYWTTVSGAEGVCACSKDGAPGSGLQGHTSHSKSLARILSKTRLGTAEPGCQASAMPASVNVQA